MPINKENTYCIFNFPIGYFLLFLFLENIFPNMDTIDDVISSKLCIESEIKAWLLKILPETNFMMNKKIFANIPKTHALITFLFTSVV